MAEAGNYKSALNEMVMKVIGRPINKADITYTVRLASLMGGVPQYRAFVKIVVLDGIEFEGEPLSRRKAAEHSAAKAALSIATSNSWASVPASARAEASDLAAGRLANHKGHLQELLAKLRGGSHVVARYDTSVVSTGRFVCSVNVTIGSKTSEFQGEVHTKMKEAEQSAAAAALQVYARHPAAPMPPNSAQVLPGIAAPGIAAQPGVAAPCDNFKSTLNELVMKAIGRPTTPQDVLYSVIILLASNKFQATVCVAAIDPGMEFEGEPRTRKKDAEQSAAQAALRHSLSYFPSAGKLATATAAEAERADMPTASTASSLEGAQSAATVPPLEGTVPPPRRITASPAAPSHGCADGRAGNYKSMLNELVMKLISRPLAAGDVMYNVNANVAGQFLASVHLVALGGSGRPVDFDGIPCTRKRDAEQSAAQAALAALRGDSSLEVISEDVVDVPGLHKSNFKSALNELVMTVTGRPLCSTDVVYSVRSTATGHFQATVKVAAIDDSDVFSGDPRVRKKEAEQSAASAAHEHFSRPQLVRAESPTVAASGSAQAPQFRTDDSASKALERPGSFSSHRPDTGFGQCEQKDLSMPTWVFCDVGGAGRKPQL